MLLLHRKETVKAPQQMSGGYSSLTQWVQGAGDWAKENLISQLLLAADPTPSCTCSWKEQLMLSHVSKELRSYTEGSFPMLNQPVQASPGRCYTFPSRKCRDIRNPRFCRLWRKLFLQSPCLMTPWNLLLLQKGSKQ